MSRSVGVGRYCIGQAQDGEWSIFGLGSCIGLILCDKGSGIWAMGHIFLPSGSVHRPEQPCLYGDEAVDYLLGMMVDMGADIKLIYAQMAGGARMFGTLGNRDIGTRNIETVQFCLNKHQIPLVAQQVGGICGRTLRWDSMKRIATVSRVGHFDEVLTPNTYIYKGAEVSGISFGRR